MGVPLQSRTFLTPDGIARDGIKGARSSGRIPSLLSNRRGAMPFHAFSPTDALPLLADTNANFDDQHAHPWWDLLPQQQQLSNVARQCVLLLVFMCICAAPLSSYTMDMSLLRYPKLHTSDAVLDHPAHPIGTVVVKRAHRLGQPQHFDHEEEGPGHCFFFPPPASRGSSRASAYPLIYQHCRRTPRTGRDFNCCSADFRSDEMHRQITTVGTEREVMQHPLIVRIGRASPHPRVAAAGALLQTDTTKETTERVHKGGQYVVNSQLILPVLLVLMVAVATALLTAATRPVKKSAILNSVSSVTSTASIATAVPLSCTSIVPWLRSCSHSPRQGAFSVGKLRSGCTLAAFSLFWGSTEAYCSMPGWFDSVASAVASPKTSSTGTFTDGGW